MTKSHRITNIKMKTENKKIIKNIKHFNNMSIKLH